MSRIGRVCVGVAVVGLLLGLSSCGTTRTQATPAATTAADATDCAHLSPNDQGPTVEGTDRLLTVDDVISVAGFEDACPRVVAADTPAPQAITGPCGGQVAVPHVAHGISTTVGQPTSGAGLDEWIGTVGIQSNLDFYLAIGVDERPGCPPHWSSANPSASTVTFVNDLPTQNLPLSAAWIETAVPDPAAGASMSSVPAIQMSDGVLAMQHGQDLLLLRAHVVGPLTVLSMWTLARNAAARANWLDAPNEAAPPTH